MAEEIKAQTGRLLRSPLLVRLAGDSFRRVLEDHDWLRNVTLMDCYLLMLIEHNGPLDSSQVMHCDPGLVPSTPDARVALDSLTRRGFLQPQPKNRRRAYHLTSAGEMVTRMLVAEGRWGLGESSSYGQEIQRLRKERRKLMEGRARGG